MDDISMKILAKINVRARAARARGNEAADKADWELSAAFETLEETYEWCYDTVEGILEEIEDKE